MLFERWPSYVPYEKLLPLLGSELKDQEVKEEELATLTEKFECVRISGHPSKTEEQCALAAQTREELKPILQPLRDIPENCQPCLHILNITIGAVLDFGYLLKQPQPTDDKQQALEQATIT